MGRGVLIGVAGVLLIGAPSICSAWASGGPGKTCSPSYGKTLVAGRHARVYSVKAPAPNLEERIYGCLTSNSKAWRLSPIGNARFRRAELVRPVLLSGPWAGGKTFTLRGVDTYSLAVFARNLKTGAIDECFVGDGIAPNRGASVKKVTLNGSGSLAWAGERYVSEPIPFPELHGIPYEAVPPPFAVSRLVQRKQVVVCTATGEQVLIDQGEGIELESLELHGSVLTWTDSGATRTAVLE